jgi:hypothetical protein
MSDPIHPIPTFLTIPEQNQTHFTSIQFSTNINCRSNPYQFIWYFGIFWSTDFCGVMVGKVRRVVAKIHNFFLRNFVSVPVDIVTPFVWVCKSKQGKNYFSFILFFLSSLKQFLFCVAICANFSLDYIEYGGFRANA